MTHASIYIVDPDGSGYDLHGHVGPRPDERIDAVGAAAVPRAPAPSAAWLSVEQLERELRPCAHARRASARPCDSIAARARTSCNGAVVLAILGEEQLLGLLVPARRAPARGLSPPTRSSSSAAWPRPIGVTLAELASSTSA